MQKDFDFRKRMVDGKLESADIQRMIDWQLTLPAEKIDCSLLSECYAYLYDDAENPLAPGQSEGFALLEQRIANDKVLPFAAHKTVSKKKTAATVLIAALLLALAAGALAWAIRHGVFNFIGAWTSGQSQVSVQEEAYTLLQTNLAHASYAHVDVDVREAVYDGHELRVVYSVWDRDATEMVTEDQLYHLGLPAALADGLTMCDYVEVNGVLADLGLTFEGVGEKPGEMLYYLSVDLSQNREVVIEDKLTLGLPIMAGNGVTTTAQYVPDAMRFSIPATIDPALVKKVLHAPTKTIGGVAFTLERAVFSPVSAAITLRIDGTNNNLALDWGSAILCDAKGAPVGMTEIANWDYSHPDYILVNYTVYPPRRWPDSMWLALQNENGQIDPSKAIQIVISK